MVYAIAIRAADPAPLLSAALRILSIDRDRGYINLRHLPRRIEHDERKCSFRSGFIVVEAREARLFSESVPLRNIVIARIRAKVLLFVVRKRLIL